MSHKNSLTLFILNYIVYTFGRPQGSLPFPHLMDFKITDIGKPVHVFEGVDYDTLPDHIRKEYNDCYAEQYKCIRSRPQHTPVCGYDLRTKAFTYYASHCQLDLHNCNLMKRGGYGMYGTNIKSRYIFYLGEGRRCEIYLRTKNETVEDYTEKME